MSNVQPWREIADELEIRNLIARLAHLADDGDLTDYIQCFTDDAQWGGGGQPTRIGRDDILEGAKARRSGGITGPGSASRHVVHTTFVTLSGDLASARSVFEFYTEIDSAPVLRALGVYDDVFTRSTEGWRLQSRTIQGSAKDISAK